MENNLENLLKHKYNQDRKKIWMDKIPMPAENKISKNPKKYIVAILIAGACLLSFLGYCTFSQSMDITEIAYEHIKTYPLASLDEINERTTQTKRKTLINNIDLDFYKAVEILKSGESKTIEAITILEKISLGENKYRAEAIWLKALALLTINQDQEALDELHTLQAISNYQNKNVKALIKIINS